MDQHDFAFEKHATRPNFSVRIITDTNIPMNRLYKVFTSFSLSVHFIHLSVVMQKQGANVSAHLNERD